MLRVGLDHAAIFQEEQARFVGGHAGDKGFGLLKCGSQAGEDIYWVDRLGGYQSLPIGS
jgi:hypothetical protein